MLPKRYIISYRWQAFAFLTICLLYGNISFSQEEYNVLKESWLKYTDAQNFLYHHLLSDAVFLLEKRKERTDSLATLFSWQSRQKEIREILQRITGPFPEKTPLNARIVRTIEKPGFRIEHIIFESQPGFYVTSSLYIPAGIGKGQKLPAVIYCSGHSAEGYRSAVYQHVIQNLVKKGFIVFAFDPVGQGERLEYPDPATGKSLVGGPTHEHSYPGSQTLLTGSSQAAYMIWDGIRAVDYLLTRREVDPSRIGITGRSGGGTQSAYIAAMDDRIFAAAPENYLTNYTRLLESIGPQDAEQNIPKFIASGLDHADFLIVRAPKPAMMITTTRDMFSIQGAVETEKEITRVYRAYNQTGNFSRVEDDTTHASTVKNRHALYTFFGKHLNNPCNNSDEETIRLSPEELRVTSKGQVSFESGAETVHSLNLKRAIALEKRLDDSRNGEIKHFTDAVDAAKKLSGFIEPESVGDPVFAGRFRKDGYCVEKYFIKGEGDYVIPFLLFVPDKQDSKYLIYLHPEGKSAEAGGGKEIESIVLHGITVLAPDLPGTGETGPGSFRGDAYFAGVSHNLLYAALLTGRSITGIYAGDIIRLAKFIEKRDEHADIKGFAKGYLSPALLHAAAFSHLLKGIALVNPYISYFSLVKEKMYNPLFMLTAVPGALKEYDLPDLAGALAPRKLLITGATDGKGSSEDSEVINKGLSVIKAAYSVNNAGDKLRIYPITDKVHIINNLIDWLMKE